jgi:hypothetical protein
MKCGSKNADNADFCSTCGAQLNKPEQDIREKQREEEDAETVEEYTVKVKKRNEQTVKNVGEVVEKVGKHVEQRIDQVGKNFEQWYDKTLGIFGPLIWSFLGLIILRLVIGVMTFAADDVPVVGRVSTFLYEYLLLFFGVMVLAAYNSYFYRRYKKYYRWVSPVFSTVVFVIVLWVASRFFLVLDAELDVSILVTISSYIEKYLIVIFVVIILLSYGFMLVFLPLEKEAKKGN